MKTIVCWSSGKDSAWTLHTLRQNPEYDVVALLTTITSETGCVSIHGVPRQHVERQAAAAGLPLWTADIPAMCMNPVYEEAMGRAVKRAADFGVTRIAFGDLFLEDIRAYRERKMAGTGIEPIFPLWKRDTRELARGMIAGGLRARIACVDPAVLCEDLVGREFDENLLRDLPEGVDWCGERGEFHTFVHGGPMFTTDPLFEAAGLERTYRGAGSSATGL